MNRRDLAPLATLLVLSPVIGEVLSGATRVSFIVVLIPEIMVWGCGTVLIREVLRRWNAGWTSALVLGFGLAIAEEFVIQQTSLAPLPWLGDMPTYGRVWGVTWPYFLFMLGFEAVWIVLVPIQVTELLFPDRRDTPWLAKRGLLAAGMTFVVGSFLAWYLWTQIARPLSFHAPVYNPPALTVLAGAAAIVALIGLARRVRGADRPLSSGATPPPWAGGVAALVFGFPWYLLMVVIFVPRMDRPLSLTIGLAVAWAALAYVVIRRMARGLAWSDRHRWALCFGALVVSMLAGFLGSNLWPRVDLVGKIVLNVAAAAAMVGLRTRIARRASSPPPAAARAPSR